MVDYSKWKDIEISDDEDDTHPNIDTPSLFRWRHKARLERMTEFQQEKDEHHWKIQVNKEKILKIKEKLKCAKTSLELDTAALKDELENLTIEKNTLQEEAEQLLKKEKKIPWNVDTISHDGFTKTTINRELSAEEIELTEEEKEEKQKQFVKENEELLKKFGLLQKYSDSKQFLKEHPHLVCEETANYLVIWCINLEVEGKHQLMEHVAHQCICMQFILELAKHLNVDPRGCIGSFFTRIQTADAEYKVAFQAELDALKNRLKERAKIHIQKAIEEAEEEEQQKRVHPGELDPIEVFESLPNSLQECFIEKDVAMLQQVIESMPDEEAKYHFKRCVKSGLWIPGGKKGEASQNENATGKEQAKPSFP